MREEQQSAITLKKTISNLGFLECISVIYQKYELVSVLIFLAFLFTER